MTSTNTGQVSQARPLPIPEGQTGKLDPVRPTNISMAEELIPASIHSRPRCQVNIRLDADSP